MVNCCAAAGGYGGMRRVGRYPQLGRVELTPSPGMKRGFALSSLCVPVIPVTIPQYGAGIWCTPVSKRL